MIGKKLPSWHWRNRKHLASHAGENLNTRPEAPLANASPPPDRPKRAPKKRHYSPRTVIPFDRIEGEPWHWGYRDRDLFGLIARRLGEARRDAGYPTREAAARDIGLSSATINRHELGQCAFTIEQIVFYSEAFGCDPGWLAFGRNGAMMNNTPRKNRRDE